MKHGINRVTMVILMAFLVAGLIISPAAGIALAETHDSQALSADYLESNDDLTTSTPIEDGTYSGLTITSDDRDYFQIDLEEGEEITFTAEFDHANGDLDMIVTDPQNDTVAGSYSITDNETISLTASQSGRYDVIVYGYDGATNSYDFHVDDRFEPNDDLATSTPVSTGEYDDLTITSDDRDYFQIDLEQGENVSFTAEFEHANGDLDMIVTDPQNDTIAGSYSITDNETISFTAPEDGRYDIIVYGWDGATNVYDLQVEREDRLEPNDNYSTSWPIEVDCTCTASYSDLSITSNDRDHFHWELDQGEEVSITAAFEHADGDLDMVVTDPQNDTVAGSYSVSDNETVSFTASESGRYDIVVYGYDGAMNSYELVTSMQEWQPSS